MNLAAPAVALSLALASLLASCSLALAAAAPAAVAATSPASKPENGAWGVDLTGMDTSVKPGDALYLEPKDRVQLW